MGPKANKAIPALIKIVSKNPCSLAVRTLSKMGPKALKVAPRLARELHQKIGFQPKKIPHNLLPRYHTCGLRIMFALKELGPKTIPYLLLAFHDKSWKVRQRAATVIGWIGVKNKNVVTALKKLLTDKHEEVRDKSQEILDKFGIQSKDKSSLTKFTGQ